jgi:hypothetical protein
MIVNPLVLRSPLPARDKRLLSSTGGLIIVRGNQSYERILVSVPLYLPQIPHGLPCDFTTVLVRTK